MSRRQSCIRFLFALKILLSEREFVKSWLRDCRLRMSNADLRGFAVPTRSFPSRNIVNAMPKHFGRWLGIAFTKSTASVYDDEPVQGSKDERLRCCRAGS
jgi:hypothetical protein